MRNRAHAHVRGSLSRARALLSVPAEQPDLDAVVSAELVACTLGQRHRPELEHRPEQ